MLDSAKHLNPRAGGLDPDFQGSGEVLLEIEGYAQSVQLTPENKILIGLKPEHNFGLARLHSNGDLDSEFGNSGYLPENFASDNTLESLPESYSLVEGKTVVTGAVYNTRNRLFYPAAARYLADGSPDPTFGSNGKVIIDAIDPLDSGLTSDVLVAKARASLSNNSVHHVVTDSVIFHFYRYGTQDVPGGSYLIALDADGLLDPSFNGTGFVRLSHEGQPLRVRALNRQADGKLLYIGQSHVALVGRLTAKGEPDPAFGFDGVHVIREAGVVLSAMVTHGDKIIALGTREPHDQGSDLLITRLTTSGNADPTFNGGKPLLHVLPEVELIPLAAIVDSGDRIVVAGRSFRPRGSNNRYPCLLRLLDNGAFDPSFGHAGVVAGKELGEYADLQLPTTQTILVAGHVTKPLYDTPLIARYLAG